MDALVQAGVDVGLGGQIWMGVGLPYAPRRHSPYGGGPPGRHRGRLSKGTKVTHDPLVKVSWSRPRHLKSCMGPFLDAIARVEQRRMSSRGSSLGRMGTTRFASRWGRIVMTEVYQWWGTWIGTLHAVCVHQNAMGTHQILGWGNRPLASCGSDRARRDYHGNGT